MALGYSLQKGGGQDDMKESVMYVTVGNSCNCTKNIFVFFLLSSATKWEYCQITQDSFQTTVSIINTTIRCLDCNPDRDQHQYHFPAGLTIHYNIHLLSVTVYQGHAGS